VLSHEKSALERTLGEVQGEVKRAKAELEEAQKRVKGLEIEI
jgi:predicted  nucleic acid-binding Zn-ribbon protein